MVGVSERESRARSARMSCWHTPYTHTVSHRHRTPKYLKTRHAHGILLRPTHISRNTLAFPSTPLTACHLPRILKCHPPPKKPPSSQCHDSLRIRIRIRILNPEPLIIGLTCSFRAVAHTPSQVYSISKSPPPSQLSPVQILTPRQHTSSKIPCPTFSRLQILHIQHTNNYTRN